MTTPTQAHRQAMSEDATVGALVHDITQHMSTLVRDEMRLAQAEMTAKGKRMGTGLGLFSVGGLLAFFGVAALVTTAILALALVLPAWLAALIVAAVLLAAGGIVALAGRSNVRRAGPAMPQHAIEGLKEDVATVREGLHHEHAG